ncbi:hypothetical protein KY343_04325 [Candidatus Woesearchaeota archaeon]|nr:hypothetical protein [Candidatus Woesearchaeota archaeon]
MEEPDNIETLELMLTSFESNPDAGMMQGFWNQFKQGYMGHLGNSRYSRLMTNAHKKIKELAPDLYEKVDEEYKEIKSSDKISGIGSIAKKLRDNPNDAQSLIKADLEEKRYSLISDAIKQACKKVGIEVDGLGKISPDQEERAVENLKSQYRVVRTELIFKLFSEINYEKDIEGRMARYESDMKDYERNHEKRKSTYQRQKEEYEKGGKKGEAPKFPNPYDYDNELRQTNSLIVKLKEEITRETLEEGESLKIVPEGTAAKFDDYVGLLEKHRDEVEADRTIETFENKKDEAEKLISQYETGTYTPQQHIKNLSEIVLAWFDNPVVRKDVEKAAQVKIPGLVNSFDHLRSSYREEMKKTEKKISPASGDTLTMRANLTYVKYEILNDVEELNVPELTAQAREYEYIAFHDFNPKRTDEEYYDERITKLEAVIKAFEDEKGEIDADKADNFEKCVGKIKATRIKIEVNKYRKATVEKDQDQAKKGIDRLAKEVEDNEYQGKFLDIYKFTKDVQTFITRKGHGVTTEIPVDPWANSTPISPGGGALPARKSGTTDPDPTPIQNPAVKDDDLEEGVNMEVATKKLTAVTTKTGVTREEIYGAMKEFVETTGQGRERLEQFKKMHGIKD